MLHVHTSSRYVVFKPEIATEYYATVISVGSIAAPASGRETTLGLQRTRPKIWCQRAPRGMRVTVEQGREKRSDRSGVKMHSSLVFECLLP